MIPLQMKAIASSASNASQLLSHSRRHAEGARAGETDRQTLAELT
jgi:hypothetical protein